MPGKGLDAFFCLEKSVWWAGTPPAGITWADFDQPVVLDEDGVTGQVAMDDGGITGVEVAGDAEKKPKTGQGLESFSSPLPSQFKKHQKRTGEPKAHSRGLQ